MARCDNLRKQKEQGMEVIKKECRNLDRIIEDVLRVEGILENTSDIIDNLNRQFKQVTKLDSIDVKFLFLATALQCVRQYVLTNDKFRLTDKQGDAMMEKVVPKEWQDILMQSVPYDALTLMPDFKESVESIGLSGTTHRYRTLGHDPLLGWVFGTVNILSDSLTKTDFSTYAVSFPHITGYYPGGVAGAFGEASRQIVTNPYNLPAAVTRQAIHYGTDYFTKQGLPVPIISTANNQLAQQMLTKWHIDMYSITRGAAVATLINQLIYCIHQLFYDENKHLSQNLYTVKTKKIIAYSNTIACTSNIVVVALGSLCGVAEGNPEMIRQSMNRLDVGGIIVAITELFKSRKFIEGVKREFIEKELYKMVMGNLELEV